jgi:acetyl/propionyl-CoA carboxylase alpha subunit/acetyl-CoA carboxylase carboxyltransferase component
VPLTSFRRVLIANRGEIAVRIARAAAELGCETVAVYSSADANSFHTRVTDAAVELTGAPLSAYLDIEALVTSALETGCDAIHPGYGFLSESASFASACAAAGLTFVGPSPEALELFGDKVAARALAAEQGIAVVPGSDGTIESASAAAAVASDLGYPVMLKAAAGGGGRGLRRVDDASTLPDAFESAAREAEAAFGTRAMLVEKLIVDPRHIEVQVFGDQTGAVVHLWERDCSVQIRNQKVLEIAPAPALDPTLRDALLRDAVRLAHAARYRNAGTVEFLVEPGTGTHWFIEANPRIQVEHTVTEEITGRDLVQSQLLIAAGATLGEAGLVDIGPPRCCAVQARVVLASAGPISAYREPSGPGIRVDGFVYAGFEASAAFDPLVAKVIASAGSHDAVLDRLGRALAEFQIDGVATNLAHLCALVADDRVRRGDARTTLLDESPVFGGGHGSPALDLFRSVGDSTVTATRRSRQGLTADGDIEAVVSPVNSTVVEVLVARGEQVDEGQALIVCSAMKMETVLTAPCAGLIVELLALAEGTTVYEGDVLALIEPGAGSGVGAGITRTDAGWSPDLAQAEELRALAHARLAPGSQDPGVVRQRSRNKLTCRERIDLLLDAGSFREIGSLAGFSSYDDDGNVAAFTPSNHVGGQGTIEGRPTVVCADDFTSRGGHSDGSIGSKAVHLDRLSLNLRMPSVRLLDGSSGGGSVASMVPSQQTSEKTTAKESTGAIGAGKPRVTGPGGSFLPSHLGSSMYAKQLETVPVVNVLLGSVVGLGAAKAVLGHFSVMLRDTAQLFVAGPPVVIQATGQDITKEDLGGWHIHCRNGSVDNLAEDEEDAATQTRRFLSYLPSSVYESPPIVVEPDRGIESVEELLTLVPRNRTTTFDIRRAIDLIVDSNSFFEIGRHWGTDQVVGLARCRGHVVGVVASDSRHMNGGALTADGCDKIIRHLELCDLFNIPVLNLVDNPGFAVGLEHEINGTIRKGGEWMLAFARISVPLFTVIMRRSFGVAGNNFAAPRSDADIRVIWPAADMGGIPPEGGIEAAYKRQLAEADDPTAFRAELMRRIESARGPMGPLNRFEVEELIDPRETRRYVCEWIDHATKIATQPNRLAPRRERR